MHFINPILWQTHLKMACNKGLDAQSLIYVWGRKAFIEVEAYAREHGIPIARVEDGFIRSIGLGSDLTRPYSLVVDKEGIYFDPTCTSDLEEVLSKTVFSPVLLKRAEKIRKYLVEKKLSKYNLYQNNSIVVPREKIIIGVVGQVEDDASIRYGANGMTNKNLLMAVRKANPFAYIIYKPHPDVLSKNRKGDMERAEAMLYCDQVIEKVGIDSVLSVCHEVHTMTSLVGFEALMRGIKVVTYGMPFYAGWGLSEDLRICKSRNRQLSLDELVAGVLLLYPRYIDPKTLKLCDIEIVLEAMQELRESYKKQSLLLHVRNFCARKAQMILRMVRF